MPTVGFLYVYEWVADERLIPVVRRIAESKTAGYQENLLS